MAYQHSIDSLAIHITTQLCPKCSNSIIILQSQRYCQYCKQTPVILYEEVRNVSQCYRPNSEPIKFSGLMKIEQHILTFIRGLDLIQTQSTINELTEKISHIHRQRGPNSKGYLQETAAAIFIKFEEQHKMTIRQFCKKFRLSLRKFNQKYLNYRRFQKQNSKDHEIQKDELKVQEKLQNISVKNEEQDDEDDKEDEHSSEIRNYLMKNEPQCSTPLRGNDQVSSIGSSDKLKYEEQTQKTFSQKTTKSTEVRQKQLRKIKVQINRLYDQLFSSYYMQQIKQKTLNDLPNRIVQIYQIYERRYKHTLKVYHENQKILYIIFGVIFAYGYNIPMKRYVAVIEKVLKVKINIKKLGTVKKEIKNIYNKSKQAISFQKEAKQSQSQKDLANSEESVD